ncbi:acetamidase/formamidase family protein [Planctomicrobium sp. SH661]|uniref:acetamidase/formamidase family protein n=1 Tax=Planctomicrobium sp. SH661 TaxID=3448124 RepID=UPI003F5C7CB0
MQSINRTQISYQFDRSLPPVLRVASRETFHVETEDSRSGKTRTPETIRPEYVQELRRSSPYYGNPVTGPVFVEGAMPGDTLAVRIEEMKCDTLGYFGYWPMTYGLEDWLSEPVTELVDIQQGFVNCTLQMATGPHSLQIPVRPMIGCIGTAPSSETPGTNTAGPFGGNLDVPEVSPGNTIYLPVSVPGGMLFLGDCHPYQGDGEVSGCEMRASVTVTVDVLRNWSRNMVWPRIETPSHLVTIGAGCPAEHAQWLAIREMILWLEERYGWTKADARKLLSVTGDLRPGQMLAVPYTMRFCVPKEHLPTQPLS